MQQAAGQDPPHRRGKVGRAGNVVMGARAGAFAGMDEHLEDGFRSKLAAGVALALLKLGGILGAMTGGEVTGFIIRRFGVETENLLFFCMVFLAVATLVVFLIWRRVSAEAPEGSGRERNQEELATADGTPRHEF